MLITVLAYITEHGLHLVSRVLLVEVSWDMAELTSTVTRILYVLWPVLQMEMDCVHMA